MDINGGCFCGALRYEAVLDLNRVGICHCRDCQIISGSAFRTSGLIDPDQFRFVQGQPSYFDKLAASGKTRRFAFCSTCGTHICSLPGDDEEEGAFISVRVATAEQFELLSPKIEIFCQSQVHWQPELDDTLRFAKMP